MAHHITVFMENHPGKFEKISQILAKNEINIHAISMANAGEFGVLKILCSSPDKAFQVLRENHVTVSLREIIVANVEDRPGGFHRLIALLSENEINVEDCYGFVIEHDKSAAIIFESKKYPEAEKVLINNGIKLMSDEELGLI